MSDRCIEVDVSEFRDFFKKMHDAGRSGELKREFEMWLISIGTKFLKIIQDEIIRLGAVDTRQLLRSFHYGSEGNYWSISDGGLTLEVGSALEYAAAVNDGHKQTPGRFIPGFWEKDRFVYDPNAKGAMVLKANYVEGKPYFDNAVHIIENMLPGLLEAKLEKWLNQYFGM